MCFITANNNLHIIYYQAASHVLAFLACCCFWTLVWNSITILPRCKAAIMLSEVRYELPIVHAEHHIENISINRHQVPEFSPVETRVYEALLTCCHICQLRSHAPSFLFCPFPLINIVFLSSSLCFTNVSLWALQDETASRLQFNLFVYSFLNGEHHWGFTEFHFLKLHSLRRMRDSRRDV